MANCWLAHPGRAFAQTAVQTQPIDPFGQEITLTPKSIVYASGSGSWDDGPRCVDSGFQDRPRISREAGHQGHRAGDDDLHVHRRSRLQLPGRDPGRRGPENPAAGDIAVGTSPEGKALKFVHRGSFESTVTTYDSISHYLEEKQIEAKELLIEEYIDRPGDDRRKRQSVINIFVPLN